MKITYFTLTIIIFSLFGNLFSVTIHKHKHQNKHKHQHKNKQNYIYPATTAEVVYTPENSETYYRPYYNGLRTPLTTGHFSRGGKMYYTNEGSIPYGTGYSYGEWKKIPM